MTVSIDGYAWIDPRTVRVTWSSDLGSPTYRVYRDGALVATTTTPQMAFTVDPDANLDLVILDTADAPAPKYPARWTLGWWPVPGADAYRVEEYVGAAWTLRAEVQDTGAGYYQWTTRVLEDETTHQFRVLAEGADGNRSTPRALSALMVRHPDNTNVDYAYSAGSREVTISAA